LIKLLDYQRPNHCFKEITGVVKKKKKKKNSKNKQKTPKNNDVIKINQEDNISFKHDELKIEQLSE